MLFPIPHFLLFLPLCMFCALALTKIAVFAITERRIRPRLRPVTAPTAQIIYLNAPQTPLASTSRAFAPQGVEMPRRRAANGG